MRSGRLGLHSPPDQPARHGRAPPGADARPRSAALGCSLWSKALADAEPKKSAPLPWLLLTGLLGVFAVGVPTSGTLSPAKKEEKKPDDAQMVQPVQEKEDAPPSMMPVYDFHKAARQFGTSKPLEQLRDNLHGYQTEFLIATVPDPIDSPYGHSFDQAVDAIQRGSREEGRLRTGSLLAALGRGSQSQAQAGRSAEQPPRASSRHVALSTRKG